MASWVAIALTFLLLAFLVRWLIKAAFIKTPTGAWERQRQPQSSATDTITSPTHRLRSANQHPVDPADVSAVRDLLPDLSRAQVEADLRKTGSLTATIDRFLNQTSHLPYSPPEPQTQKPSSFASSSKAMDIMQPMKVHQHEITIKESPMQVWESTGDARQLSFQQRKQFMIEQARQKYLIRKGLLKGKGRALVQ